MLNFEKSLALKHAGFPQPEPMVGQRWYLGDVIGVVVSIVHENEFLVVSFDGKPDYVSRYNDLSGAVFAPTETDILFELQKYRRSGFLWNLTAQIIESGLWSCKNYEKYDGKTNEFLSVCPAEACADAYLFTFSISKTEEHF